MKLTVNTIQEYRDAIDTILEEVKPYIGQPDGTTRTKLLGMAYMRLQQLRETLGNVNVTI